MCWTLAITQWMYVLNAAKRVLGIVSPCLCVDKGGDEQLACSLFSPTSFHYITSNHYKFWNLFFGLCCKSDTYIDYTSHYRSGSSHTPVPLRIFLEANYDENIPVKFYFFLHLSWFLFSFASSWECWDFYITKTHKLSPNRELSPEDISSRASLGSWVYI